MNEILDDLIIHYKRGGKKAIAREVSPQMESHLKRLRDYFGTMKAVKVGTRQIEDFITYLKSERKANATVNRSLQLFSQAYRYAVNSDPPKLSRVLTIPKLDEGTTSGKGNSLPKKLN